MRWTVLVIFAYIVLGLDEGASRLLGVSFGSAHPTVPWLLFILATYVAAWAPSLAVGWAMIFLGLLWDLSPGRDIPAPALIGPGSIAFVAAGVLVVRIRSLFRRDSPLGIAALVLFAGIACHLTYVILIALRAAFYGGFEWSVANELYHRFWELLYTALFTLPFAWLLLKTLPLWAFEGVKPGPYGWR